jgi:hypothetical protein
LLLRLLGSLRLLLLLLLRLLGPLRLLLLLLLRLLGSLRLLLLLLLRLLGPLRLLLLLLPTPLRFRFALLLIALRVRRVNRPEKHKQGSDTDHSNQLHRNRPPLRSRLGVHANGQSAAPRTLAPG